MVYPETNNWISNIDTTSNNPSQEEHHIRYIADDWLDTLEWIKLNTPENAVIASWWDYGYWITTMSDRTTIVDNATLSTVKIEKMAKMLMGTTNDRLEYT